MKFVSIVLSLALSFSALAQTEIGKIQEKNSPRSLVYTQDGDALIFSLQNGGLKKEIKRLYFSRNSDSIKIAGDRDVYHFNFLKKMTKASGRAYEWCWSSNDEMDGMSPALMGVWFMGVLLPVSAALCAVAPGTPFILGLIASPIDGAITLGDRHLDADAVAAKKFNSLLKGENKKASQKVFESLLLQIKSL